MATPPKHTDDFQNILNNAAKNMLARTGASPPSSAPPVEHAHDNRASPPRSFTVTKAFFLGATNRVYGVVENLEISIIERKGMVQGAWRFHLRGGDKVVDRTACAHFSEAVDKTGFIPAPYDTAAFLDWELTKAAMFLYSQADPTTAAPLVVAKIVAVITKPLKDDQPYRPLDMRKESFRTSTYDAVKTVLNPRKFDLNAVVADDKPKRAALPPVPPAQPSRPVRPVQGQHGGVLTLTTPKTRPQPPPPPPPPPPPQTAAAVSRTYLKKSIPSFSAPRFVDPKAFPPVVSRTTPAVSRTTPAASRTTPATRSSVMSASSPKRLRVRFSHAYS